MFPAFRPTPSSIPAAFAGTTDSGHANADRIVISKRRAGPFLFLALALVFRVGAQDPGGGAKSPGAIEAGLFCDLFTLFELTNRPAVPAGYTPTGEDLSAFVDRPAFLSAGFFIRRGWLQATMMIDLHQDIGAWLMGGAWSNLPKAADSWTLMWGNNYPQVGYAEAQGEGWQVSAGRRRIGLGPGSYGLAVSADNPWYDHALARVEAPVGTSAYAGRLGYSFTALGVQRWWGLSKKNVFIHRVTWRTKRFSLALGELNLVVGDSLDLQDIGPFLVYHHLFNSNSNVMFEVEAEARPIDPVRLYGEFVLDDVQIPGEGSGSNPNAMGFMAGAEWSILKNARALRPAFFRADHEVRLAAPPLALSGDDTGGDEPGGLRLRAESYLTSTYLYRRGASSLYETWTTRYFFQTSTSLGFPLVEPFFSSPLGPDTWLNRLELAWDRGGFEAAAAVEYRILGAESEQLYFAYPYAENWLGPQDPVTRRLDFVLKALYAPNDRLVLTGGASLSFRESETRMSIQAGLGYRFGIGAARARR